jgi:OmpA family.
MKYKRKPKPQPSGGGAPRWLTTYSDMVTLVLCLFVLLYSMSQVDILKFRQAVQSFQNRSIFQFYPSVINLESDGTSSQAIDWETDGGNDETPDSDSRRNGEGMNSEELSELLQQIAQFIEESDLKGVVVATRTERGVVLVLPETVLFNTGEAEILDSAVPFLNRVAGLLKKIPNIVKVEGHTDSRPISSYRYPSNWELSTARASSVIRFFIEKHGLDPSRFIAAGYGDTRPVAPNDTEENMQKNRRVEIVIMDPAYEENEHSVQAETGQ